jgi:hypothetical protein
MIPTKNQYLYALGLANKSCFLIVSCKILTYLGVCGLEDGSRSLKKKRHEFLLGKE